MGIRLPQKLPLGWMAISAAGTLIVVGFTLALCSSFGVIHFGHNNDISSSQTSTSSSAQNTGSGQSTISIQQQAPLPSCTSYQTMDSQTWLQIVKDPNSHAGECLTIFGEVTQFDSATGTDGFRANVGGVQQIPNYGFVNYPTNTVLTGDSTALNNVVEKDLFTANVVVLGSYTYSTQIGGQTTVPQLRVNSIQVTGSLSN